MNQFKFRFLESRDKDLVADLIRRNNIPFDSEIPLRSLASSIPEKSLVIGCFGNDNLIGIYMTYAIKLFFSGIKKEAAIASFNVVDKSYRKKGLGIQLAREMAKSVRESGIDFVISTIKANLVGKWSEAINQCWSDFGYHIRKLRMVTPCFRIPEAKLPDISRNELSEYGAERLSNDDMDAVLEYAEKFLARYYVTEIPDKTAIKQLAAFPDRYFWYSIRHKDRKIGYISGYMYRDPSPNRGSRNQFIFNMMMVDEIHLPGAVNSVVSDLENREAKYDLYVINNSSLTNRIFLFKTAFNPGFTQFQPYIRCCAEDNRVMETFRKIGTDISFSLPII